MRESFADLQFGFTQNPSTALVLLIECTSQFQMLYFYPTLDFGIIYHFIYYVPCKNLFFFSLIYICILISFTSNIAQRNYLSTIQSVKYPHNQFYISIYGVHQKHYRYFSAKLLIKFYICFVQSKSIQLNFRSKLFKCY